MISTKPKVPSASRSFFVPARFAQGYRPLRYATQQLKSVLDWRPPLDLDECLALTFAGPVPWIPKDAGGSACPKE